MSQKKNKRALNGHLPKKNVDLRETITDWYVVLMLLVYCLWCPEGFTNVEKPKFVFFAAVTLVWFVFLVLFSLVEGPPTGFFTPARISALVFAAVCLLSAVFSPFDFSENIIGHRYTGLLTQLLLAMILLGVSRFGHCRERHFIAFGISITILGIICVLQRLGINVFGLYPGDSTYFVYYTFLGTIGNIDTLAALICLALPLFLGLFVKSETPYDKVYPIPLFFSSLLLCLARAESGLLGVMVVSVITPAFLIRSMKDLQRILSGTAFALTGFAIGDVLRTCIVNVLIFHFNPSSLTVICLVFAAVLCSASWLLRFVRREPSGHMFRNAFIIVAVVCVVGTLTVVWFWPRETGTVYEVSQILHGHFEDSYGNGRIGIWKVTLTNVPEAPLLGGGPGTLHLRTVKIFTASGVVARLAHNAYLQYLVDTGILGLLSYLAVIATSIFVRRRDQWNPVYAALILAVLSYAVQDFFNLGVPVVSPFFWIVLGLLQTETHKKPSTAMKGKGNI